MPIQDTGYQIQDTILNFETYPDLSNSGYPVSGILYPVSKIKKLTNRINKNNEQKHQQIPAPGNGQGSG